MFSFEGEFCRRPVQNLSGFTSNLARDRDSLIKNAQVERQKREQARREHHSSLILTSVVRSFLERKKFKQILWTEFHDYIKLKGLIDFQDLDYLLKRLLHFYDSKRDADQVIQICQFVMKNSQQMFNQILPQNSTKIWLYRIQKLLIICIRQIFQPEHSFAIPLRMLEIFTSFKDIKKILSQESEDQIVKYLMSLFNFLIDKNYFKYLRQMIDERIPEFTYDSETTRPYTQMCRALLEMLERPLHLIGSSEFVSKEYEAKVLESFTSNFLSKKFNNTIEYFVIPSLAANLQFPYANLINYLSDTYQDELNYKNSLLIDLSDGDNSRSSRKKTGPGKVQFNSFLLYAVLRLDKLFIDNLNDIRFLEKYLNVIAAMIHNLSKLPRATSDNQYFKYFDDAPEEEDSSDDESDQEDSPMHPAQETGILKKIIEHLNEGIRVTKIANNIDGLLDHPDLIISLCKCCHNLLTINRLAINEYSLLYTLAFKPHFIRTLWYTLLTSYTLDKNQLSISLLSKGIQIPKYDSDQVLPVLATFCALFGRLLTTLHDGEFFYCFMETEEDKLPTQSSVEPIKNNLMPFKIKEIELLATTLKDISMGLVELAFPETRQNLKHHYSNILTGDDGTSSSSLSNQYIQDKIVWSHLLKACVSLMRQLYTRDLRCNFCPPDHWIAQNLNLPLDKPSDLNITKRRGPRPFQVIRDFTRKDIDEGPPLSTKQVRSITILREIPFVVSFNTRVSVFQGLLAADKLRTQGDLQGFLQGPQIHIVVRRTHLYEDAFEKLSPENEPNLKSKFRVQLINTVGLEEAGVDGGGIFREFLSVLIKASFDPHRGLFLLTKDNMLYPNPSASKILENYMKHYYFVGRMLGKALYENLLVELPLAEFFLSKLAGRNSDILDMHQLISLDPVLHRNLMSLKAYEGDVLDLGLDFTVVCDELGKTRVVELKPNGSNIAVTSENKLEYIQLMADFKLNKQIRNQCLAFRQGLANVLPIEWLYMFSNKELQVLISGAEIPVDVEDLRNHARYSGDYNPEHKTIKLFWKAVHKFDDLQRRQLLRFVTSCSRPPLLGFKDLDPPFCIQNAGDTDRLPSASTCMNLLKLPAFNKEETLREKLLYAIQSGVGFELS